MSRRKWMLLPIAALLSIPACLAQKPPAADHHAHLQSAIAARLLNESGPTRKSPETAQTARDLIAVLDAAGISQAVALSDAYRFGAPWLKVPEEAAQVERENAWTLAQAAKYPGRLVPFCSVNPLKGYAEAAVRHCYAEGMRGLKLHLANSGFRFDRPQDVRALASIFHTANHLDMAILIHLRTGEKWDSKRAMRLFFSDVLPEAPDVTVQIAHLTGWGGYDRSTDAGLTTLLDLCAKESSVCRHVYFDIAAVLLPASAATAPAGSDERMLADEQADFPESSQRLATNLRRIGMHRILFATDWPEITPAEYVSILRSRLPLKPRELDQIFRNRAPYFRTATSSGRPARNR